MFKRSHFCLVFAVLALALLPAVNATASPVTTGSGFPVTVNASNGTVVITSRPTAIVSLSPTATEMLYSIGAGSQIRAVDSYSDYPKGAPMTSLSPYDPNVEAIAKYHPDLVILSDGTPTIDHQLVALGIKVLDDNAAGDLSQEYQQFIELGEATGHLAAAKAEVISIKSKLASIVRHTPRPAHPLTYYYELEQTYYSVTSSTFVGQLLGLLGLKSIADPAGANSGGYPQLSAEFILKANPNYIFLADTLCCGQSAATVGARPAWSILTVVKEHRIVGLNDDIASRWGPRVVILLQEVADEIKHHPVTPTSGRSN